MQPPIPIGTILQNRYRLMSILGQGGFGRTYLAEDTGRFNELCALKEFIPLQTNAEAVAKSQELFSREAAILYQIKHPQIPQFRATFEENQRLFLLQDYVEGKTYRTILQERQVTNNLFSEAEVLTFLRQMLPVLAHIHNCGIIHRDISPDNIIRRDSDQMPVLIDFGVVKELATRVVKSPDLATPLTNVGKFGYAPWEQMQLGRATPSSDIYALAVTAVVLLTGKEPQQLIDQTTLTWNWQRWVTVSTGFAQVINKMLSRQPGDRYQSVSEVGQALETLPLAQPQQVPSTIINQQQNNHSRSQQPTVAATPDQDPDSNNEESFLGNHQWVAIGLVAVLVVFSGLASWSAVNFILKRRQQAPQLEQPTEINPIPIPTLTPTPSSSLPTLSPFPTTTSQPSPTLPSPSVVIPAPSPTPELTLTPLPTPTPDTIPDIPSGITPPSPVTSEERLNVLPGEPISIEGSLKSNETVDYIISGSQGQNLNLLVTGEGVLMSILGTGGEPVDRVSEKVSIWKGTLPTDGNYKIILTPLPEFPGTDYKLDINLINPTPEAIPAPKPEAVESPLPTPTPEPAPVESPLPAPTPEPKITTPTPETAPVESPAPAPTPEPETTPTPEPAPVESPAPAPTPEPETTPTPEPAPVESPAPTPEPEATESPSALPLNKPANKQIETPSPTATPLEELDKPPKTPTATPETTETPSATPVEETSPKPQVLVE